MIFYLVFHVAPLLLWQRLSYLLQFFNIEFHTNLVLNVLAFQDAVSF